MLLAEDNPVNQRVAVRMLEKSGHSVTLAEHGGEAVAAWAPGRFDIVLMDVQMPHVDGFEATRMIREKEAGTETHTPIVAMTAHAMVGDRERCIAAGMDEYLSKPVHRLELLRIFGLGRVVVDCRSSNPAAAADGFARPRPGRRRRSTRRGSRIVR